MQTSEDFFYRFGDVLLQGTFAGFILGDYVNGIAGIIVGELRNLGLNGRLDVMLALILTTIVWSAISKWVQRVSVSIAPQARDWNFFLRIVFTAVNFFFLFAIKTYFVNLISEALNSRDISAVTYVSIVVLGFLAVVVFYNAVQKFAERKLEAPERRLPFSAS